MRKTSRQPQWVVEREIAELLARRAKDEGVDLVGPGGLLQRLTKQVLETGLEVEMSGHLGYDRHDPVGRDGGNSRNGTRSKTVTTEVRPVEIDVPRDRDGSFEPKTVQREDSLVGIGPYWHNVTEKSRSETNPSLQRLRASPHKSTCKRLFSGQLGPPLAAAAQLVDGPAPPARRDQGPRRGESCGLRWPAVDLDAGTVTVEPDTLVVING